MSLKASISGIRGIIGDSLTPTVIVDYLSSYMTLLAEDGDILIGRDSRISGDMITSLVKGTVNAHGRNVVDIGIAPTPAVLFGVLQDKFAGGIIVTASHNPKEWNALKLVNGKGKFLSQSEFEKLINLYHEKDFKFAKYDHLGKNSNNKTILSKHINKIFEFVNVQQINKANFRVVVDAVNGAGGPHAVNLLKKLGCDVICINEETTGNFAHNPEPTPENLAQLSEAVKNYKADIGFALDPDADRLVISDENGTILSEELTLALCIKHYLINYKKTPIVTNMSTSRIIEDIAIKYDCEVFRVATGEINVTEKMEEIGSKIGGEGNGGIILPDINKCRDAFVGMALILEYLSKNGKKVSDIIKEFPKYVLIKDKISAKMIKYSNILENILIEFKNEKINTSDGVRIDFDNKWVLFRKSNTEPIIRIFAEARTENESFELIDSIKKICNIMD